MTGIPVIPGAGPALEYCCLVYLYQLVLDLILSYLYGAPPRILCPHSGLTLHLHTYMMMGLMQTDQLQLRPATVHIITPQYSPAAPV